MIRLFLRRVWNNKIYWLAIVCAWVLLLCSVIYTDPATGEAFTFLSLFYEKEMQNYLKSGGISLRDIWMGNQMQNYLGMFAPIIAGVPCILNQRKERLVLFRGSKNGYFLSKYIANVVLGGGIFVLAQLLFVFVGIGLLWWMEFVKQMSISLAFVWDIDVLQRFWMLFYEGILYAVPGIMLAEFIRNKYLILCVPFVGLYLVNLFVMDRIPFEMQSYILPKENPIVFVGVLVVCGAMIKGVVERRCDCGQQ